MKERVMTTKSEPDSDMLEELHPLDHPERGWFDDDWDNYGFDDLGNTTDRNFGQ
jgi:hypothetical protein